MALNYAKTDEAKTADLHGRCASTARRCALMCCRRAHPKTACRSSAKRFMDTMKDPEFLAEAKKANLDINPDDGATLESNVKEILKLEPALIAKLKEILK